MNNEELEAVKNAYLLIKKFREALEGKDEALDNIIHETLKGMAIIVGNDIINKMGKGE